MKIAVIGLYYAANLGDAVICDSTAYLLKRAFPDADIRVIDIEGKKEFAVQEYTSMRALKKRNRTLKKEYWLTKHHIKDWVYHWNRLDVELHQPFYESLRAEQFDAVVFAGGQLFMDWLSLDISEILSHLEKDRTLVFFNACGTGPSYSEKIRTYLSRELQSENIKLISTRDDVELINRLYLKEEKKACVTYDPALWAKEVYGAECSGEELLGLGIMYSTHAGIRKITGFWIRLIRELERRGIRWKMFCNGAREDYDYGCYVLEKLGRDREQFLCHYPEKPEELVNQISQFGSLISFRLHSHIIAASLGIPAVAIVWDKKLRFFYQHLGHEERCKTIESSPAEVIDALEAAKSEKYDFELIQKQKETSERLLTEAVRKEVCR
ncbi:MAG: polysaccharide pyruvyl transferase family protein [Lachnospiraceae bacterium]